MDLLSRPHRHCAATKPRILQNAEFWPTEVGNYPRSRESIVSAPSDGAGFDVMQHDGIAYRRPWRRAICIISGEQDCSTSTRSRTVSTPRTAARLAGWSLH